MILLRQVRLGLIFGGRERSVAGQSGTSGTIGESAYNLGYDSGYSSLGAIDAVRLGAGIGLADVRLVKSPDGNDLLVQVLNADGLAVAELRVENHFAAAAGGVVNPLERIEFADSGVMALSFGEGGLPSDDRMGVITPNGNVSMPRYTNLILGSEGDDVIRSIGGTDKTIIGGGGNDTYYLGLGTGKDTVVDISGTGDMVRIELGIAHNSVRLRRDDNSGDNLYIELLNDEGGVTDSLQMVQYFSGAGPRSGIEAVVFADDGTLWDKAFLDATRIIGGSGDDILTGLENFNDVFDGDAGGNDTLRGLGGDDIYYLGRGTGHDIIEDTAGAGDVIRVKEGADKGSLRLNRVGDDILVIELLGSDGLVSDSFRVKNAPEDESPVEQVVLENGELVWSHADLAGFRQIGGASRRRVLRGDSDNNVFDTDGDRDADLRGGLGHDVYYLDAGTGHDRIIDDEGSNVIRVNSGVDVSLVRVNRAAGRLVVELLGSNGEVTDSLRAKNPSNIGRIEVESADGTVNPFVPNGNDVFVPEGTQPGPLDGGLGHDLYYLGLGSGDNTITDSGGKDAIRLKSGIESSMVRLNHSGARLAVELLANDGSVASSFRIDTTAGVIERIEYEDEDGKVSSSADLPTENNRLRSSGGEGNDVFDSLSGDDDLRGGGGHDLYYLGTDSGEDTIIDTSGKDAIRVESGVARSLVALDRDGDDLIVGIYESESNKVFDDTLRVEGYYNNPAKRIERVEFELADGGLDSEVWESGRLKAVRMQGDAADDELFGTAGNDVFDGHRGGNDDLYGEEGDDVYYLGLTTDSDTIFEYSGDDVIRVKSEVLESSVELAADGNDLLVRIGADGASLRVDGQRLAREIERVEFEKDAAGTVGAVWYFGTAGVDEFGKDVSGDPGDGNDRFYGYGGDDVYYLGLITGADTVFEYGGDDVIRVKSEVLESSVELAADGNDLLVRIGADGASLRVDGQRLAREIERVEFEKDAAGTVGAVWYFGTGGVDEFGKDVSGDPGDGNDRFYGYGGDDVYYLGSDTGLDTVNEHFGNSGGDSLDVIKIKSGIAVSQVKVHRVGDDLHVEVLNPDGAAENRLIVDDYYTKESAKVERIEFADSGTWFKVKDFADFGRGGVITPIGAAWTAWGTNGRDVFDTVGYVQSNSPQYNWIAGHGGDDIFFIRAGTGAEVLTEDWAGCYSCHARHGANAGDGNDVIRVGVGFDASRVSITPYSDNYGFNLRLLDENGERTGDLLAVESHFRFEAAKVEYIEFNDGTVWDLFDIAGMAGVKVTGTSGNDLALTGRADYGAVFDADAGGDDILLGENGKDIYALGWGTDADTIREYHNNPGYGDFGDYIRIENEIDISQVRLEKRGDDLVVKLLNAGKTAASGDQLTVERHFSFDDVSARIESIRTGDKVLSMSRFQGLVDAIATFDAGNAGELDFSSGVNLDEYWKDLDSVTTTG